MWLKSIAIVIHNIKVMKAVKECYETHGCPKPYSPLRQQIIEKTVDNTHHKPTSVGLHGILGSTYKFSHFWLYLPRSILTFSPTFTPKTAPKWDWPINCRLNSKGNNAMKYAETKEIIRRTDEKPKDKQKPCGVGQAVTVFGTIQQKKGTKTPFL